MVGQICWDYGARAGGEVMVGMQVSLGDRPIGAAVSKQDRRSNVGCEVFGVRSSGVVGAWWAGRVAQLVQQVAGVSGFGHPAGGGLPGQCRQLHHHGVDVLGVLEVPRVSRTVDTILPLR